MDRFSHQTICMQTSRSGSSSGGAGPAGHDLIIVSGGRSRAWRARLASERAGRARARDKQRASAPLTTAGPRHRRAGPPAPGPLAGHANEPGGGAARRNKVDLINTPHAARSTSCGTHTSLDGPRRAGRTQHTPPTGPQVGDTCCRRRAACLAAGPQPLWSCQAVAHLRGAANRRRRRDRN